MASGTTVTVIDPASKALAIEAPLLGLMDALEALPDPHRFRRFGSALVTLSLLAGVVLGLYYGTVLKGLWWGDAAQGLFLASAVGLCLRRLVRKSLFHARGHPGDDPRRRPELVLRVLRRLRADLAHGAPLRLRLRPHPHPKGPGSSAFEIRFIKTAPPDQLDPWLQLETRLLDGAHLRLSAVERRRIKVSKNGPNGPRRRTKIKEFDTLFLEARLRVKAKRHPQLAALSHDEAREAVRLPPGAKLQRLRITGERLQLRVRLEESWLPTVPKDAKGEASTTPDASLAVTMMLLSLYQMLHIARTPAASKAPAREKPSHRRAKSRRRRSG